MFRSSIMYILFIFLFICFFFLILFLFRKENIPHCSESIDMPNRRAAFNNNVDHIKTNYFSWM